VCMGVSDCYACVYVQIDCYACVRVYVCVYGFE
jgi:hypothetical protein